MKILLAVSGGIDSMYMANRASELFPEASFAVAHCNFQLRGEEALKDEEFVLKWCTEHCMECHVRRFNTMGYAAKEGISMEMAARDLRYGWFKSLCVSPGYDAVSVAHNANDNAETMFLNLIRGTGSRGMRGMAERSERSDGLVIIRPLLNVSRKDICEWMTSRGLPWREDATNRESIAKRNVIRNEMFPVIGRINPNYIATFSSDMKRFAQVDDIAEEYFRNCGITAEDGEIPVDRLLALTHWQYVLWRLLENCGFSQQTFDKLTDLLSKYKESPRGTITMSGKTFESPAHILKTTRNKLIISKLSSSDKGVSQESVLWKDLRNV